MNVGELIQALQTLDPGIPVHMHWSHGSEPGEVTQIGVMDVFFIQKRVMLGCEVGDND